MQIEKFVQYADPLDSSSWRGMPPYTEEINQVTEDGALLGFRWAYVKRTGRGLKSKKLYPTIEAAVTAYYAWKHSQ